MASVSLCMIVKNEEAVLARALESVGSLADEIVLVDTGSTDGTKRIALRYTDRVFDFPWCDDFSKARNESFRLASMEYCLWLDADDVLTSADREALCALKARDFDGADVVMVRYHVAFDAQSRPTYTFYRERIVRRGAAWHWRGAVHEALTTPGKVIYADAAVHHRKLGPGDPDRNLRIFEKLLREGHTLDAREQFYYARELWYHRRFRQAADGFLSFLDGGQGWAENCIEACLLCGRCLLALGEDKEAMRVFLRHLEYGAPRAEICCELGDLWLARERPAEAAHWYRLALRCKKDETSGAFLSPECYDFRPCVQLCVCYYRMGDLRRARACHALARALNPEHEVCRTNEAFFAALEARAPS